MIPSAQHPLTCIRHVRGIIVASAGPNIYTFSARDGRLISVWPKPIQEESETAGPDNESNELANGPPEKRRKLSPNTTSTSNQPKGNDKKSAINWMSVPILVPSPSGRHVVAVTPEDKHVRVFELSTEGALIESSDRPVPRRPCAVAFSSDENTIICADKGGDVYSMPLLPGESGEFELVSRVRKSYKPAGNPLVVHTKRNLDSLQQQLRQKMIPNNSPAAPTAKRDVLSGEVSTLTDMIFAVVPSNTSGSGFHSFILTADRDEQIRVSRGPPQTHVIQAYCLGHEAFISTLCIPSNLPHLLVSGGGDDSIFVWDWRNGQLLHKVSVLPKGKDHLIVRKIWAVTVDGTSSTVILVALDGSRSLLSFLLEENGHIIPQAPLQASGNILDVTWIAEDKTLLISVDHCHKPDSIRDWRSEDEGLATLLELYTAALKDGKLAIEPAESQVVNEINMQGTAGVFAGINESAQEKTRKAISESLYNLHNLRKRVKSDRL